MRRRTVDQVSGEIPARLLKFRFEDWRDPDDSPMGDFPTDAHLRAHARYRAARRRWADANGGLAGFNRLAEEAARRFPPVDPRREVAGS